MEIDFNVLTESFIARMNAERRVDPEPIFFPSGSSESPTHSERRRREFSIIESFFIFKLYEHKRNQNGL